MKIFSKASCGLRGALKRAAIMLLLLPSIAPPPLGAQEQVIDKIVAVVGNVAISSRELMSTLERVEDNMAREQQEIPDRQALVPRVLEELIVVKLQLQEAQRVGITVDEVALDRALEQIAANNDRTLAEMKAEIEQQQGDYAQMRESVRQEIIISQLKQREVINRIKIPENEIEAGLRALNAQTLFRFSYLVATLPDNDAERLKLARYFDELRNRMIANGKFARWAERASERPAIDYQDSPPKRLSRLPELLQEQVLNMNIGDITPVIKSANKLYLFSLDGRRAEQLPEAIEKQYRIRHILLRSDAMNSDSAIRLIKKRLAEGADFETLAKRYSQDPGSGFKGGDLGWLPTAGLVPEFAQQVERAPRGQLIGPFATDFGHHLLQVLGKREQDVSSRLQRQNVIAQLRREKSGKAINEWLLRLRESQYIDIRL